MRYTFKNPLCQPPSIASLPHSLPSLARLRTFSVSSSLRDSSVKPPREKVRLVMALPCACAPFSTCATRAACSHAAKQLLLLTLDSLLNRH